MAAIAGQRARRARQPEPADFTRRSNSVSWLVKLGSYEVDAPRWRSDSRPITASTSAATRTSLASVTWRLRASKLPLLNENGSLPVVAALARLAGRQAREPRGRQRRGERHAVDVRAARPPCAWPPVRPRCCRSRCRCDSSRRCRQFAALSPSDARRSARRCDCRCRRCPDWRPGANGDRNHARRCRSPRTVRRGARRRAQAVPPAT